VRKSSDFNKKQKNKIRPISKWHKFKQISTDMGQKYDETQKMRKTLSDLKKNAKQFDR